MLLIPKTKYQEQEMEENTRILYHFILFHFDTKAPKATNEQREGKMKIIKTERIKVRKITKLAWLIL